VDIRPEAEQTNYDRPRLVELNDAELDAVAGGITLSFGSFGGAQNRNASGERMGNPAVNTRAGDPNARSGDPAARNMGLDPGAVTRFLPGS
jgi:hypothetical protein